jgi:hypothetical protein
VFETARRAPRPRPRRRYTEEDDAALRAFVAARPALKPTGLKIWQQAFEQKVTQHSVYSMQERYKVRAPRATSTPPVGSRAAGAQLLSSKGAFNVQPVQRPPAVAEADDEEPPAKAAKLMPPRRRTAANDAPAAEAEPGTTRFGGAAQPPHAQPPPHAPEPLARALARAFAPSAHLASSAKTRGPRRLFSPPTAAMAPMKVLAVRTAKRTYPTGDPSFAVQQAFPAGAFAGAPLHASASGWAPGSAASRNSHRRLLTPCHARPC